MTASRPADEHTQTAAEVYRETAASVLFRSGADNYDVAIDYVARELAAAEQRGRDETFDAVLHWLGTDTEWAANTEGLGLDVALGIDHARRRIAEMRAGRWPHALADRNDESEGA